ncbi:hypothetical protein LTR17_013943 [Elasticomyces elasticus]|nr:hypothetical protein LTR17_013943 [Elasticomyces elasticus]
MATAHLPKNMTLGVDPAVIAATGAPTWQLSRQLIHVGQWLTSSGGYDRFYAERCVGNRNLGVLMYWNTTIVMLVQVARQDFDDYGFAHQWSPFNFDPRYRRTNRGNDIAVWSRLRADYRGVFGTAQGLATQVADGKDQGEDDDGQPLLVANTANTL